MVIIILKKLFYYFYRKLTFKGILNFEGSDPDVSDWLKYIKSIPKPTNDIERCYAKFLCRMHYFSTFYKIISNSAALIAWFFSFPVIFRKAPIITPKNVDCILIKSLTVEYYDIIPEELIEQYGEPYIVEKPLNKKDWYLSCKAKEILKQSFRKYPTKFYFNYIIFRELCMHSALIDRFETKAMVVYVYERNIAGPILTSLCEQNKMEFVTFMHGDYLLHLIQGFMRFNKFYVWDSHYSTMFKEDLRCDVDEFVQYTPRKYTEDNSTKDIVDENEYYACYYFGGESVERINKVAEAFHILKKNGKKCKVRPHPRRSNLNAINLAFRDFVIENPHNVSVAESIISSKFLIALSSTVLSEGYYKGKEIVIDDYSEPERYENIIQRKYIILNKKHKLFSKLIEENIREVPTRKLIL